MPKSGSAEWPLLLAPARPRLFDDLLSHRLREIQHAALRQGPRPGPRRISVKNLADSVIWSLGQIAFAGFCGVCRAKRTPRRFCMKPRSCVAIVLAGGEGTRMRSARPKVLHTIAGRSLLAHVLAVVAESGVTATAVVV